MLNGRDIVCVSTTNWDDIWGSRQQIMTRLARANRVLYVETQVGPEHLLRDRHNWQMFRRWREGIREIEPNLRIWAPPLLPPGRYYARTMNAAGQALLRIALGRIIRRIGFERIILWIFQPNCAPLVGAFGEELALYHCIDEFSGGTSGRKRRIILDLEAELIRRADLVFINNQGTLRRKGDLNPHTHLMPSAADLDHFNRPAASEPPSDLTGIPRPLIVQVGSFSGKCDVDLIRRVALAEPRWSFVIIGEVWRDRVAIDPLEVLPNVHFLGKKNYAVLPDYLRAADVCMIPYRVNDETASISPLKLYEYMAAGRPIVSTPIPEVVEQGEAVGIAATPEEFRRALAAALESDRDLLCKRYRKILERNNWNRRIEEMSALIERRLAARRARNGGR